MLGLGKDFLELGWGGNPANPLAPATGRRFQQDRIAELFGNQMGIRHAVNVTITAGNHRDPGFFHLFTGVFFIPHQINCRRARPNKGDPASFAQAGKFRILREKTIAGVDRFSARPHGRGQDIFHVQVGILGPWSPHTNRFIRQLYVQTIAIRS